MTPREKYTPELENLEIELLLQAIRHLHGVDLRECSPAAAPVRRRIWEAIKKERVRTVSGLQERLLHDSQALVRFLESILPPVFPLTAEFLFTFRRELVPILRTYPFIRIWQIGCSSVFETYALAIILLEEGVYEKSVVYGTDVNEAYLDQCSSGIFPLSNLPKYENMYEKSGGRFTFSTYYSGGGESGMFDLGLRKNMVFSRYNLSTDSSFNEFNAVLCRTPLKFYDRSTQAKARQTILESLVHFGILGLTPSETLDEHSSYYIELSSEHNLFRKAV